ADCQGDAPRVQGPGSRVLGGCFAASLFPHEARRRVAPLREPTHQRTGGPADLRRAIPQFVQRSCWRRWYPVRLTGRRVPSVRIASLLSLAYSSTFAKRSMLSRYDRWMRTKRRGSSCDSRSASVCSLSSDLPAVWKLT